jgi:hypothetical protein
MAIFTFDDLNEMQRDESDFFGSNEYSGGTNFAPRAGSLSLIQSYSQSLSLRKSKTIGDIRLHLN